MVNKSNIDSELLELIGNNDDETTKKLLVEPVKNKTIKKKDKGALCIAAVPYATKSIAYKDIEKGIEVYIVIDENDKKKSYSKCSKKKQDNCDYCHIHKN